ncbi:MAG: hypothetical protein V1787_02770 [Candidatus Micrarchaeota archaeon]
MVEIRAQSGIEMAAFSIFLIMLLMVFVGLAQQRQNEVYRGRDSVEAWRIADLVATHINSAVGIGDGYSSQFVLPPSVYGEPYRVEFIQQEQRVVVYYGQENKTASAGVLTADVVANFTVGGENPISKEDGVVTIG